MISYLERISAGSAQAGATDIRNQSVSPIAAALTTPDYPPLEAIQLPITEELKPQVDAAAQEMWLAYQEAMAEPTPPRPLKPKPLPHRPGLITNPTWSEKTDTYTNVTPKTLYFGNVALARWRADFIE